MGKDTERRGKSEWEQTGQGNVKDGKKEMSEGCEKQKNANPNYLRSMIFC